jgi:enoyl-CoA hydratase/carnithine racemase
VWTATTGIIRLHEAMVDLDRPIVAKVNGDAIGWGSSVAFASDFIIAREDARFADHHMGMGEVQPFRTSAGMVPGDGGLAHIPSHMSPALAKEYLMLARVFTGRELADRGVINYAVTADELDARVEQIVAALLKRSAYALAWTKRVAGQHIKAQMQLRLDASVAYQLVNIYQLGKYGDQTHLE